MHKRIQELLNKKTNEILTPEDTEKLEIVQELLKNDNCFFNIDIETAFGILEFLGVTEEEVMSLYKELISPQAFSNARKDLWTLIDDDSQQR